MEAARSTLRLRHTRLTKVYEQHHWKFPFRMYIEKYEEKGREKEKKILVK